MHQVISLLESTIAFFQYEIDQKLKIEPLNLSFFTWYKRYPYYGIIFFANENFSD